MIVNIHMRKQERRMDADIYRHVFIYLTGGF